MLASESEIATQLGSLAKERQLSVFQPQKNKGYTVIKADGSSLENAISIWRGKITFYSEDSAFIDTLNKSGYSVSNKPYRAEPSGSYRFEFSRITRNVLLQGSDDFERIIRNSATFVSTYRSSR